MKSINFPQALVLLACIAAPIAAYKWLGSPEAAAASMVVGMILNFLLGRPGPSQESPVVEERQLRVVEGGKDDA